MAESLHMVMAQRIQYKLGKQYLWNKHFWFPIHHQPIHFGILLLPSLNSTLVNLLAAETPATEETGKDHFQQIALLKY